MPHRPPKTCSTPRCGQPSTGGRCPSCLAVFRTQVDANRPTAAQRGYGRQHRERFRAGVLARDPVCVICHERPSTHADHHPLDRRALVALGEDPNNPVYGRGLCASCDSRQTGQRQPGGINRDHS